jgi:hypothetical protein
MMWRQEAVRVAPAVQNSRLEEHGSSLYLPTVGVRRAEAEEEVRGRALVFHGGARHRGSLIPLNPRRPQRPLGMGNQGHQGDGGRRSFTVRLDSSVHWSWISSR